MTNWGGSLVFFFVLWRLPLAMMYGSARRDVHLSWLQVQIAGEVWHLTPFCFVPLLFSKTIFGHLLLVCSNLTWIIAFDRGTLDHLNQVYDLVDPSLDANMQYWSGSIGWSKSPKSQVNRKIPPAPVASTGSESRTLYVWCTMQSFAPLPQWCLKKLVHIQGFDIKYGVLEMMAFRCI